MSRGLQLTERRTAQDLIRASVRKAIVTGQIPAGTRLGQTELAQQLGFSTTPVREALRGLAAEGLIQLDAHRGAVVNHLSREELEDVYWLRCLLEPEALRRAVSRITEEDLEHAAAVEEAMRQEQYPDRWIDLNAEFHRTFVGAAASKRLSQILDTLQDSFAMYIMSSHALDDHRRDDAELQHQELLNAMRARDGERAVAVMLEHLGETLEHIAELPAFCENAESTR